MAEAGEVVALVGSSGAGKSTLVDLIPRFYDPQQGRVLIDGRDVREVTLASLRSSLGIVTQEVILFNDTVRNNIAYGLGDVPQDGVEAAARAANAHEFIERMPHGYDTRIGDRGTKLSGGQRQRVWVSMALAQETDLLLLTEIYPASESPIPGVSGQSLAQAIKQVTSTPVLFFEDFAAMQAALGGILREGDLFLTLGAGSIWTVGQNYLDGRE